MVILVPWPGWLSVDYNNRKVGKKDTRVKWSEIFLQASLHQISDLLTLVSSLYWIQRKSYGDFGSLARLAFGSDLGMMKGCAVFYDRQSQSCTAGLPGMTFIYTIKAFVNSLLFFFGNSYSGVLHLPVYFICSFPHPYP